MKKKLVIIILVFAVFIGTFIVYKCSKTKENITDIDDVSTNVSGEELSPVNLTFYMYGEEKQDTKEVLNKVAKASNLNINLNFEWFDNSNYNKKVVTAINSNEMFDGFLCGKPELEGMDLLQFYRKGRIKDLSKLLPQYAPRILEQLSKQELDACRLDGNIVMIPQLYPMVNWLSVYLREDLADKYKISSINTFDEYENLLKMLKENEKDIIPGIITDGQNYNLNFMAKAFGYVVVDYNLFLVYKWDDPEMKIIPWEQTPEFKESTDIISRWFKNGYTVEIKGNEKNIGSFIALGSNIYENSVGIDLMKNGDSSVYKNFILYKDKPNQRYTPLEYYPRDAIAFNSSSTNVERALMFLNWIQSDQENYDLFMYGIKGKHYNLENNKLTNPKGIESTKNPYKGWDNNAFLNVKFDRTATELELPDTYSSDLLNFVNKYAKYAPHNGFYPDYSGIVNIVNKRATIYADKVIAPFSRCTYNTANTEIIISDLKNAGSQLLVDEVQKQLNKWKVNNKKNK